MRPDIENLNHPLPRARHETMNAFIEAGQDSVPVLLDALYHPETEVAWRSAATLGWIGDPSVIPALEKRTAGAIYEIKLNCIWALGQIGDPAAVPFLMSLFHADDCGPDERCAAGLALLRLGQIEAIRAALTSGDATYRVAYSTLVTAQYRN
jgi:HEAT repeat protein